EMVQAGAGWHGGSDADDGRVGFGKARERLAENILIIGRSAGRGLFAFAADRIERPEAVEFFRMLSRGLESQALFGQNVEEHGLLAMGSELEIADEAIDV